MEREIQRESGEIHFGESQNVFYEENIMDTCIKHTSIKSRRLDNGE